MSDEDLIGLFLKCAAAVACTVIVVCGGCTAHTHYRVSQDIKAGVDPLLVACAHNQDNSREYCIVTAAKR